MKKVSEKRSTVRSLYRMQLELEDIQRNKKPAVLLNIDLEKAFDSVWVDGKVSAYPEFPQNFCCDRGASANLALIADVIFWGKIAPVKTSISIEMRLIRFLNVCDHFQNFECSSNSKIFSKT